MNLKLELDPTRDWWSVVTESGKREDVIALLQAETDQTIAAVVAPESHKTFRTLVDDEPEHDRLQSFYWLILYGALCGTDYASPESFGLQLARIHSRWIWFELVTMTAEARIAEDVKTQNLFYGTNICRLSLEETTQVRFWLAMLRSNPRRFIDNKPVPFEDDVNAERCTSGGECFGVAVATVKCGAVNDRFCQNCVDAYAVKPEDSDELWHKDSVLVVFTYDSDRPRLYYQTAPINVVPCPRCGQSHKVERFDECCHCGHTTFESPIQRSHLAPAPDKVLRLDDEPDSLTEHFGVELEVEFNKCLRPNSVLAKIFDHRSMTIKYDGSLQRGAEIVSAPASYAWWINHAVDWTERLNVMRKAGFRSFDGGRCGMHIHIDRRAFSPNELLRVMELVYGNRELFARLSQRTDFTYCSLGDSDATDIAVRIAKAKNADPKAEKYESYRRVAVNVPLTHPTVEIRLFRGTLNVASFWKNLECVKAIVDFVKSHGTTEMTEAKFLAFIADNAQRFRHLTAFLAKEQKPLKPTKPVKARKKPDKLVEVRPTDFAAAEC